MRDVSTRARNLAGICIGLVILTLGALFVLAHNRVRDARDWVEHTHLVQQQIQSIVIDVECVVAAARGFVVLPIPNQLTLKARCVSALEGDIDRMREMVSDNPVQIAALTPLRDLVEKVLTRADLIITASQQGRVAEIPRIVGNGSDDYLGRILDWAKGARAEEARLLAIRDGDEDRADRNTWLIVLATGVLSLGAFGMGLLILGRENRERQQAEAAARDTAARLEATLSALPQAVALVDDAGNIEVANDRLFELHGIEAHSARRYHLNDFPKAASGMSRAATAVPHVVTEGDRSFEIIQHPAPANGQVIVVQDVTTRVRDERLGREVQKMEALGRLTGGVAHDFNNLLTIISGSLDMLQRAIPESDERARRRLTMAISGVDRGVALTRSLLAFGRRQPLEPVILNVQDVMLGLIPLVEKTVGERIEVILTCEPDLWLAFADPARVENAILNLAINARDAMPEGGHLRIECSNVELDDAYRVENPDVSRGDYVRIAVIDDGTGMSAEVAAKAFEPFFTTKETGRGTGLGLSQVFGFAKQSNGHVRIISELGAGTRVKLYLPRDRSRASAPVRDLPQKTIPLPRCRILVVEDDPDVRTVTVEFLREAGHEVLEAETADAGRDVFEASPVIDLLLSDVMLPGTWTSRDLANHICARDPRVCVLFMSGYEGQQLVIDGKLDHGVHLITKPFRKLELFAKIAQVMLLTNVT